MRGDDFAIGIKNVTFNEPQFLGHFPGQSGVSRRADDRGHGADRGRDLHALDCAGKEKEQLVYFLTIDKAKFRKPVIPGDTIEYHMTKIAKRKTMWWFAARRRSRARSSPRPKSAP